MLCTVTSISQLHSADAFTVLLCLEHKVNGISIKSMIFKKNYIFQYITIYRICKWKLSSKFSLQCCIQLPKLKAEDRRENKQKFWSFFVCPCFFFKSIYWEISVNFWVDLWKIKLPFILRNSEFVINILDYFISHIKWEIWRDVLKVEKFCDAHVGIFKVLLSICYFLLSLLICTGEFILFYYYLT